jgi:hypothetical protein
MLHVVWVQNASQKMQPHQSSSKTASRTEETQISIPKPTAWQFVYRNVFVAHSGLCTCVAKLWVQRAMPYLPSLQAKR